MVVEAAAAVVTAVAVEAVAAVVVMAVPAAVVAAVVAVAVAAVVTAVAVAATKHTPRCAPVRMLVNGSFGALFVAQMWADLR